MRKAVQSLLLACTVTAFAQVPTIWFTIQGDPLDPGADIIEVNPAPLAVNGNMRTMQVRVSRSAPRTNWDGVPYRSYSFEVLFDCTAKTARYTAMEYFMQPRWAGSSHASPRYTPEEPRPMRFRDVEPNPTAQIIRAACGSAGVISN